MIISLFCSSFTSGLTFVIMMMLFLLEILTFRKVNVSKRRNLYFHFIKLTLMVNYLPIRGLRTLLKDK